MSKVIDSMWINTPRGTFGIVATEDETTRTRGLLAGIVSGHDQKFDEQSILHWGSRMDIGMLEALIARTKKK